MVCQFFGNRLVEKEGGLDASKSFQVNWSDFCSKQRRTLNSFKQIKNRIKNYKNMQGWTTKSRLLQWYHSHADLVWLNRSLYNFSLLSCTYSTNMIVMILFQAPTLYDDREPIDYVYSQIGNLVYFFCFFIFFLLCKTNTFSSSHTPREMQTSFKLQTTFQRVQNLLFYT